MQLFAIAIILFVLFLLAPRTPGTSSSKIDDAATVMDDEVQDAVEIVKNSKEPKDAMAGILKLRDILEKNPQNIDAAWNLGLFSMQTSQFEIAISRFAQVLEHDEKGRYPEALFYMGQAQSEVGQVEKAKSSYSRFLESVSDPELKEHIESLITELDKQN